jgi:hypothetical protein
LAERKGRQLKNRQPDQQGNWILAHEFTIARGGKSAKPERGAMLRALFRGASK